VTADSGNASSNVVIDGSTVDVLALDRAKNIYVRGGRYDSISLTSNSSVLDSSGGYCVLEPDYVGSETFIPYNVTGVVPRYRPAGITAMLLWNPGTLANGASIATTISAPGAAVGDIVLCSHDRLTASSGGFLISGTVVGADAVVVTIFNASGSSFTFTTPGYLRVLVFKRWSPQF
jgi:hypothetical protein